MLKSTTLKPSDREKLQDCLLLVQSARNILSNVRDGLIPGIADMQKCFLAVDRTLTTLLRT
jgi:hypothetical protein